MNRADVQRWWIFDDGSDEMSSRDSKFSDRAFLQQKSMLPVCKRVTQKQKNNHIDNNARKTL